MASPYRKRYPDPSQVESDHKDVLVSQLKAEAFELRQNERDYTDLNARVNNLNHRYNLLQDERELDEKEHNYRNEQNLKTIRTLRDEVENYQANLKVIESDVQDVRADNGSIDGIVRSRTNELAKLKSDLVDLHDENSQLNLQNKELDRQVIKVQNENKDHASESNHLTDKVEEAEGRKIRNERLIAELESGVDKLLKTNDDLKEHQEDMKAQVKEKITVVKETEHNAAENRKRIITLESRLNDRKRANEKIRVEIAASQQEQDGQNEKNVQINNRIKGIEADIGDREEEIDLLRKQVEELRREQHVLLDNNDTLVNDIKVSNRHLDVITLQNYNLVDEVEKINREDEEIRAILSRRERIQETTGRCNDRMKVSTVKMNSSLLSPVKTASTRDGLEL